MKFMMPLFLISTIFVFPLHLSATERKPVQLATMDKMQQHTNILQKKIAHFSKDAAKLNDQSSGCCTRQRCRGCADYCSICCYKLNQVLDHYLPSDRECSRRCCYSATATTLAAAAVYCCGQKMLTCCCTCCELGSQGICIGCGIGIGLYCCMACCGER